MKSSLLLFVLLTLANCQSPDAPLNPASLVTGSPMGAASSFPGDFDFFADLPATFSESAQYRVASITVRGVQTTTLAEVHFSYDEQGRLATKSFRNVRQTWQHTLTYDAQNRLIRETPVPFQRDTDRTPVLTEYTYDGNNVVKEVRKTISPGDYNGPALNLVTTYQYVGNRRTSAVVLNYYNSSAVSNVPYPMDSIRRRYVYPAGRTVVEQDSSWRVPCYPGMPCANVFSSAGTTQRQFDDRNNLLTVNSSLLLPSALYYLYPQGKTTFQNEYNGPDGLLSRRVNVAAGLADQFLYQKK